jgi:hypothetical protein
MDAYMPPWEHQVVPLLVALVALAAGAALGYLRLARPLGPDPAARAELAAAVTAIDRELAANLELTSLFDQTRQAVVLENGEFGRHQATLERTVPASYPALADLYARIAEMESAMERRGPANSLKESDRAIVEAWEGDARAAQRGLREALAAGPLVGLRAAIARLRGRRPLG